MRTPKLDIDIYYASSVSGFTGNLSDYLKTLDENELAITARFKHTELRERYIICHGILRQSLAEHVNQSPADLRIEKTEFGKPFLPDHPELSFNMSHSGNVLAIAVTSQCQLGIDVECYKERNTWEGLVKKCFATEESDFWYSLDQAERSRVFYQFWVKKEAFVKAVGKGISLGLNQCVINPDDLNTFLRVPDLAGKADNWQIYSLNLAENQFGAVVCDKKNTALRIKVLKGSVLL
ncbi:4-phosphopantetheinyl transferase [Methylococcaceae bacterium HT1]|nr:4-phosphopantetheinyl transferase [Methylococcaceae bacterium HT1]TXL07733.1 4-phosphopantetheinyl transferase [Methylococcaceae bacterium CS1]TXL10390.1 4-phosphopantetheinyl transferase [Methylococcaceae bacterium CS2]TXL14173.1 4-phosphopantetheinyl transferase [Methylococcaceae bacterium HT4]TXL17202.1 4-phosphopantetheinyl transferase [Methylococcaceae bacterium HT3]TXL19925.1 4-phosphopantetheinyl transferase [Methylococcaceae bacterium HT5]TXL23732.1 4-phosphopantetheinyl transferas